MTPRPSRREALARLAFPYIARGAQRRRPNILFAVADDMSWAHTSFAGDPVVRTPGFDRVASSGIHFTNAVCASPGCAPSRAAILTGKHHWQLREAGTHASYFPRDLAVYPALLAKAGYFTGLTGKGAGPCEWKEPGWPNNPAGLSFDGKRAARTQQGVSPVDYAANFADFLGKRPSGQPFCFWYGCHEPHRPYLRDTGLKSGKRIEQVKLPAFLPDHEIVRRDVLDYLTEIEHFDRHLGAMLKALEEAKELENTLVVVTGDNGMSFPGSKATMYEYGIHAPLAISWPAMSKGGRTVDDMVGFVDFAPTFLDAAGLAPPADMSGKSLLPVLQSGASGSVDRTRGYAFSGRERHSHARFDNLGYPARGVRTRDYLYIRNFRPDRWPAGDPEHYYDVDACPTLDYLREHRGETAVRPYFEMALGKRPSEQLFDIRKDPGCMNNLAESAAHRATRDSLRARLEKELKATGDSRVSGGGDIWESYPRLSPMRDNLGGFHEQGQYNPKYKR